MEKGFEEKVVDVREDIRYSNAEEIKVAVMMILADLQECRNALCLKCGRYEHRLNGSCDDCRWK